MSTHDDLTPTENPTPPSGTSIPPAASALEHLIENEVRSKEIRAALIRAVADRNQQHAETGKTLASLKADMALALRKVDACITDVRGAHTKVDGHHLTLRGEIAKVHNRQLAEAQWARAALGDIYEKLGGAARELGMRARADSIHDEKIATHDKALATRKVIAGGVAGGVLFAAGTLLEKVLHLLGVGK